MGYQEGKKARRIASVIYVLIMAVIVGGSHLAQQQDSSNNAAKPFTETVERPATLKHDQNSY